MNEVNNHIDSIPRGWTLNQQEVANGVYKVRLTAYFGSIIEMIGTEVDELMARCIELAKEIEKQLSKP